LNTASLCSDNLRISGWFFLTQGRNYFELSRGIRCDALSAAWNHLRLLSPKSITRTYGTQKNMEHSYP